MSLCYLSPAPPLPSGPQFKLTLTCRRCGAAHIGAMWRCTQCDTPLLRVLPGRA